MTTARHAAVVRHLDALARTRRSCTSSSTRKDIEVFLPTVTRWSRWKDRKKKIDWPLFPGYCFARFDPRRLAADR